MMSVFSRFFKYRIKLTMTDIRALQELFSSVSRLRHQLSAISWERLVSPGYAFRQYLSNRSRLGSEEDTFQWSDAFWQEIYSCISGAKKEQNLFKAHLLS
jgi:hypothetical protein